MLLDRKLLERVGDEYRVVGPVEQLEVPETLHALIAARLDALPAEERRLLEDASVLGKTFTKRALAEVSGRPEEEVEPLLASLVRKEVLGAQADPRSPERGQYGFLQALIQRVTYETLSRVERKARHLAVAAYLEGAWRDEEELVEVLAAHYLDAYRAQPDAADGPALKERARDRLREAGERAASLGANREAERYFEQAVELADSVSGRAGLHERVGDVAAAAGRTEQAYRHYEQAVELFSGAGDERSAALVSARVAEILWLTGRLAEALERTERAYETLHGQSDEAFAAVAAELGRLRLFSGNLDGAAEPLDVALAIGQRDRLHHTVAQALITRSLVHDAVGRPEESTALMERALALALALDAPALALRAYHNLAFLAVEHGDQATAIRHAEAGLAFARQRGDRRWEDLILSQLSEPLYLAGRWDEALQRIDEIAAHARRKETETAWGTFSATLTRILVHRGELQEAQRLVDSLPVDESTDLQEQTVQSLARTALLRARGLHAEALGEADSVAASADAGGPAAYANDGALEAIEIALELGDVPGAAERLARLDALPPVKLVPLLDAQRTRLRARLAVQTGDAAEAEVRFKAATAHMRELDLPFHLAVAQVEQAEWLAADGRSEDAAALVAEARETFERLGATPWLERAERVGAQVAVSA
jgi:tetratricopeptide (TPR) repeat protein